MPDAPPPVEIRTATAAERIEACRLVFEPPGPEAIGLLGSEARARAFGRWLLERGIHPAPAHPVIAAFERGRPVGVMVLSEPSEGAGPDLGAALRGLPSLVRILPPWRIPGLAWRGGLRARLDFPHSPGSLHVEELHVAPARRSRGLGARLLAHAEARARERGLRGLQLTTLSESPARRLYERAGYRVIAERTAPGYRERTGSPGRVLMEKTL